LYISISTTIFKKSALKTTATVIDVESYTNSEGDTRYKVYLAYDIGGKKYESTYSTSFNPTIGSTETIYYDKNNPAKMKTSISISDGIMAALIGIPIFIINLLKIFYKLKKESERKRLSEFGDKIDADFKEIITNNSDTTNKRKYSNIICTGKDNVTGQIRIFKSENIMETPFWINGKMKVREITTFTVYIDKKDVEKYYVSLEELE